MIRASKKILNHNFDWDQFDSDAYFYDNYATLHDCDKEVFGYLLKFWDSCKDVKSHIDVGTGTNLYPLIVASHFAGSVTAWEFGKNNCHWLSKSLAEVPLNNAWYYYTDRLQKFVANKKPQLSLNECVVKNESIFELPSKNWDAATMFFCAESITNDATEFLAAMDKFFECIKPRGYFFCVFMEGSEGYRVSEKNFPAYNVNIGDITSIVNQRTSNFKVHRLSTITKRIRKGYNGMIVAYGKLS